MPNETDTLEVATADVPNLTRLNWRQPLVASLRLAIYGGLITTSRPITAQGQPYEYDQLKQLSHRDHNRFDSVERFATHEQEFALPFTEPGEFMDELGRRIVTVRKRFEDRTRSGAVIAILLTELGWPVHAITQILNTSRPTLNRWIMVSQPVAISDEELDLLSGIDMLNEPNGFSYLVDIRTPGFKTRRTGLIWKKAVFLPTPEVVASMKALWRIAYRVRGDKSPYQETVCSHTLDLMIEMLMRRGVTALNLGKILNVQHMAVLQRNRKSQDYFGQVERGLGDFSGGFYADGITTPSPQLERLYDFTSHHSREPRNDENNPEAILLQVRTNVQTKSHPIPPPNVAVLSRKVSYGKSALHGLDDLDDLPLYDVSSALDAIEGEYAKVIPTLDRANMIGLIEYLLDNVRSGHTVHEYASVSPVANATVAALGYDALHYHFPGIVNPLEWYDGEVLTEALLLQATMQYDRTSNDARKGFGKTTYHWVPTEVSELITIRPESEAAVELEELRSLQPGKDNGSPYWIKRFLPPRPHTTVNDWLLESEKQAGSEHSLLWKCLFSPADILDEYDAPVRRPREAAAE